MKKDFQRWHTEKTAVDDIETRPFFHEREIWFCSIGINVGFEQDGKGEKFLRPVVIIKKFNNQICWCIPLTKNLIENKFHFTFMFSKDKSSSAILSQIRLIDARRLCYKTGTINKQDFNFLKRKLIQLLE